MNRVRISHSGFVTTVPEAPATIAAMICMPQWFLSVVSAADMCDQRDSLVHGSRSLLTSIDEQALDLIVDAEIDAPSRQIAQHSRAKASVQTPDASTPPDLDARLTSPFITFGALALHLRLETGLDNIKRTSDYTRDQTGSCAGQHGVVSRGYGHGRWSFD